MEDKEVEQQYISGEISLTEMLDKFNIHNAMREFAVKMVHLTTLRVQFEMMKSYKMAQNMENES